MLFFAGTVNDIEISQEEADTLDQRSPKKVEGHKSFTRDASVAGNMQFNGLVDGKDITRGLTLNTEQTVTAYYVFEQKTSVTGDVTVTGNAIRILKGNSKLFSPYVNPLRLRFIRVVFHTTVVNTSRPSNWSLNQTKHQMKANVNVCSGCHNTIKNTWWVWARLRVCVLGIWED